MINKNEAPEGMIASPKKSTCNGCFYENYASCGDVGRDCMAVDRKDGEDVIFTYNNPIDKHKY